LTSTVFFFSSRRRHTRFSRDWSSDVCSSDLVIIGLGAKPLIEDFIAGFFLLSQESLGIGDYVKIDDIEGYVEAIKFRTLIIRGQIGRASCRERVLRSVDEGEWKRKKHV